MEYELADIVNDHIKEIKMTPHQHKVLNHIMYCRTKYMGGHLYGCDNPECNHTEIFYNSCRDRHCPKCLGSNQIKWKNKKIQEMLPVDHNHLVFKTPRYFYQVYLFNQEECYKIQFDTIREILSNSNFKLGYQEIIHTWNGQLNYHPHIHCVLPNVKIGKDNKISKNLKIDIEKLNIVYLRTLKRRLLNRFKKGKIIHPLLSEDKIKSKLTTTKKYIHIERSVKDPAHLINYLGNFTNKIAIDNHNIKAYDGQNVIYCYKDRRNNSKLKEINIDAKLFLKRFMLHILPSRFTKIRYYGYMANNCKKLLSEIRYYLIENYRETNNLSKITKYIAALIVELNKPKKCSCCNDGDLIVQYSFSPTG